MPLNNDTLEKRARQVLGVAPEADTRAIKKAYRLLARQCHPDYHPGDRAAAEKFVLITEAYEYLLRYKLPGRNSSLASSAGQENGDPREQYARWWMKHFREFF